MNWIDRIGEIKIREKIKMKKYIKIIYITTNVLTCKRECLFVHI